MQRASPLAAVLFLCCGTVFAAIYGDFAVPDVLSPEVHAESTHGGRIAVAVTSPDGSAFVLYLPEEAEDGRPYSGLQTIGLRLPANGEIAMFNLGGRLWVGTRRTLPEGGAFYDGYVHRNGLVYNIGFSIDGLAAPDSVVKRTLSRVRLLPELNGSPAMDGIVRAADLLEMDDRAPLPGLLETAAALDAGNWIPDYLLGCIAEGDGEPEKAREHYLAALAKKADDVETAARAAAMQALADDAEAGVAELQRLGAMDPDEAVIWEELGKIYLAGGEDDEALAFFNQAACVNPTSEITLYNLSFLLAEKGDYENALRRAREFVHYHSWMPSGTVPDVSGAPGMTEERVRDILAEPLPTGCVAAYGGPVAALPLREEEIRVCSTLLAVEYPEPVYREFDVYVPVFNYEWDWYPRRHRPHKPKPGFHKPKPPWEKPGKPGVRPPKPPRPPRPGLPGKPGTPPEGPVVPGPGHRPPLIKPGAPHPPFKPGDGHDTPPPRPPRAPSDGRPRPPMTPGMGTPVAKGDTYTIEKRAAEP